MKEAAVERRLKKRVEDAGGVCMKVMPVVAGYPDRLVILPWGRFYFAETKRPVGGELRPAQCVFFAKVGAIGAPVVVLWSVEEVDKWVDARLAEGP